MKTTEPRVGQHPGTTTFAHHPLAGTLTHMTYRIRRLAHVAGITLLVCAPPLHGQSVNDPASAAAPLDSLRTRLLARIGQVPGATVGIWYRDLGPTGRLLGINADSVFHAASTMKVPVMVELFRAADRRAIRLDQAVLLVNRFRSIVDGSSYALTQADDSDSTMYARLGTRVTVAELVERMIVRSSNLATNAVIELVGAEAVQASMRGLGAGGMQVRRGVEDGKAFQAGINNTATPRAFGTLLEAIERRRAASEASCTAMLAILGRQELNEEIPAALPPGTGVAHKTGSITAVLHDGALVYPPGRPPYVLVVLTRGIRDEQAARALIRDVTREVHALATR